MLLKVTEKLPEGMCLKTTIVLPDQERSCEIFEVLNVVPLLRIDRSQLRWVDHVTRMPLLNVAKASGDPEDDQRPVIANTSPA